MMRMEQQQFQTHLKPTKLTQNASNKVNVVVQNVLLPLLSAPIGEFVSFQIRDSSEVDRQYLEHLSEREPSSLKDRDSFVQKMTEMYDGLKK